MKKAKTKYGKMCSWTLEDNDDESSWVTTCGEGSPYDDLVEGTPESNGWDNCPYCGKEIYHDYETI